MKHRKMFSFSSVCRRFNVFCRHATCRHPPAALLIDVINASGYRPDPEVDETRLSAHAHVNNVSFRAADLS